jgi:hypothetical protein
MLREDWRRIQRLAALQLSPAERRFSYRAHRFSRLMALVTAGPALLSLLLLGSSWWVVSVLLWGGFLLANAQILNYLRRKRGLVFTLLSVPTLLIEMVWAEVAVGWAMLKKLPRR